MVVLRTFSNEEYEVLVYELTEKVPVSFDMLCSIAERSLRNVVKRWCYEDAALRGRNFEDDIMQEIFIRLIKTCVTGFLKRDDREGKINRNPAEFYSWMFTVAVNIKKDFAKAQRRIDNITTELIENVSAPDCFSLIDDVKKEKISEAFKIAIKANKKVQIVLTWLIQGLLIIRYDITKIEATQWMVDALSDNSLLQIWQRTTEHFQSTPWIKVTEKDVNDFEEKLNKIDDDNIPLKNKQYRAFYMEKGGKATISDWVNRMNSYIKSRMNYEPFND